MALREAEATPTVVGSKSPDGGVAATFSFDSATSGKSPRAKPAVDPAQKARLEEAEKMAMALQGDLRLAERLGVDTSDATSTLAAAALAIARGSADEAMGLLGKHAAEVARDVQWKFEASVTEIEEREGKLREDGIAADVARQVSRARSAFEAGHKLEAVQAVASIDQHLSVLEREWRTLKETLLRLDALKAIAEKLNLDTKDVSTKLSQVRAVMSDVYADTATIQEASNLASGALVLLHEQLREKVAVEAQHAAIEIKERPLPGDVQEQLESRVRAILRQAKGGRIKEAAEELVSYRDLRRSATESVAAPPTPVPAKEVEPEPTPPVAPAPPETPSPAVASAPEVVASPPSVKAEEPPAAEPPKVEKEPPKPPVSAPAKPAESPLAPALSEGPTLKELLNEAREMASELKSAQKAGKDVKAAAGALKEATVKLKGGDLEGARIALQKAHAALTAI